MRSNKKLVGGLVAVALLVSVGAGVALAKTYSTPEQNVDFGAGFGLKYRVLYDDKTGVLAAEGKIHWAGKVTLLISTAEARIKGNKLVVERRWSGGSGFRAFVYMEFIKVGNTVQCRVYVDAHNIHVPGRIRGERKVNVALR